MNKTNALFIWWSAHPQGHMPLVACPLRVRPPLQALTLLRDKTGSVSRGTTPGHSLGGEMSLMSLEACEGRAARMPVTTVTKGRNRGIFILRVEAKFSCVCPTPVRLGDSSRCPPGVGDVQPKSLGPLEASPGLLPGQGPRRLWWSLQGPMGRSLLWVLQVTDRG